MGVGVRELVFYVKVQSRSRTVVGRLRFRVLGKSLLHNSISPQSISDTFSNP